MPTQSSFRSAILSTFIWCIPSTLVAIAFAFASMRFHPFLFFGTVVMGLVAGMHIVTQLRHIARLTKLVQDKLPVPMLLTTDSRWRKVKLQPAEENSGLPTISKIKFVTNFSGLSLTARQQTPVQVYIDSADPDVLAMRIDDRLLSADIQYRYTQGGVAPVREYNKHDSPIEPAAASPVPEVAQITQAINKLGAENSKILNIITAVGAIVLLATIIFTGAWRIIFYRGESEINIVSLPFKFMFPIFLLFVIISIRSKMKEGKKQIASAIELVRKTSPVPHTLQLKYVNEGKSGSWLAILSDPPAHFAVDLGSDMDHNRSALLSGTVSQVYYDSAPEHPVVISTSQGVLVGTRAEEEASEEED